MNIRKTVKLLAIAGSVSIVPGLANSAEPTFGGWTAPGGVITHGAGDICSTGFTCVADVVDTDFEQSTVTDGTDTYVRTITSGASFSSENFVRINSGSTNDGIKALQDVEGNTTQMEMGWANTGENEIEMAGNTNVGIDFINMYDISIDQDNTTGATIGKSVNVYQEVWMDPANYNQVFFDHRRRSGTLVTGGSTGDTVTLASPETTDNDTVTFDGTAAGTDVMVTWIGQYLKTSNPNDYSEFGFQSFNDNNNAGASGSAEVTSLITNNAVDWAPGSTLDNIFGFAPSNINDPADPTP